MYHTPRGDIQSTLALTLVSCREARLSLTEQICTLFNSRLKRVESCADLRAMLAEDEKKHGIYLEDPRGQSIYGSRLSNHWQSMLRKGPLDAVVQMFSPKPVPKDQLVNTLRDVLYSRSMSNEIPRQELPRSMVSPSVHVALRTLQKDAMTPSLKKELQEAITALSRPFWLEVWGNGIRLIQTLHRVEQAIENHVSALSTRSNPNIRRQSASFRGSSHSQVETDDDLFFIWLTLSSEEMPVEDECKDGYYPSLDEASTSNTAASGADDERWRGRAEEMAQGSDEQGESRSRHSVDDSIHSGAGQQDLGSFS